jgi:hypothetical protein
MMAEYVHRQSGSIHLAFLVTGCGLVALAAVLWALGRLPTGGALGLGAAGAAFLLAAALMGYLEVRGLEDRLLIRFGPLPLLRTSVRYGDMAEVKVRRVIPLLHLGVQGLPGLFLAFNIGQRRAVQIELSRRRGLWRARRVIVGTDEPRRLAGFLRQKMGRGKCR